MDIEKSELRKKCKTIRSSQNNVFYSYKICNNIKNWDLYKNAKNVMIFFPIGSELSLLGLLSDINKNFYFPCISGDSMDIVLYNKELGFKTAEFDIKVPLGTKISNCNFIDIAFLPALAADNRGYRLGYGKGYYDRFLSIYTDITKALPVTSELLFEEIPVEAHDVRADYLITEKDIITITC